MYQVSVPVMNATVTPQTREEYLRQFKACEVKRVFLVSYIDVYSGSVSDFALLQENISFFEANGIEAAIWVGSTIGHGGLTHDESTEKDTESLSPLINFDGEIRYGTHCPLNKTFRQNLAAGFAKLATSGAKLILIDDDFRLSQHGKDAFCCLCPLHIEKINQICGEQLTREQLRDRIFGGKPNKYRNAYLKASGDSLHELAKCLREAVDEVDPTVGLALCSCHCHWDSDGVTPIELTNILKGQHAPVLRLQGAPYWPIKTDKKMPTVFEIARMMASFCKDTGFELLSEGDAYPRPRYHIPASFLELQDALIQADGNIDTSFKYMFDYTSSPTYETGYADRHVRDLPLLKKLRELFSAGEQVGVKIVIRPNLLQDSDCDLITPSMNSPYPTAGILMGYNTIPTTYTGHALCRAAFGQNIEDIANDDLDGGLILDAASAILLTERGIDVGLNATLPLRSLLAQTTVTRLISADQSERALLLNSACKLLVTEPKANAIPMLYGSVNGKDQLLCYHYENANGQRFLVYLFEGMSLHKDSGLFQGYLSQKVATEGVEWISRTPLPAKCQGHPQLYQLCKKTEKGLLVALFNCHADSILEPKITLSNAYQTASYLNTSGKLCGNTVSLSELSAYSWAAFYVEK